MLSALAVGYLFLGGAGAGACAVSSVLALLVPRDAIAANVGTAGRKRHAPAVCAPQAYRRLIAPGYLLGFLLLAVGCLLLVADLGSTAAALLLVRYPTPTLMSAGAYALALSVATSLLLAYAWGVSQARVRYRLLRAAEWSCLALGLFVSAYTGLLLSTMGTVPFWDSPWLPALFVLSSFSCGCALVVGAACLTGSAEAFGQVVRRLLKCDLAIVAMEALAAALLVSSAFGHPYAVAAQGAASLLTGAYAMPFLFGFGVCGLLVPAAVEAGAVRMRASAKAPLVMAMAAVLAGAFLMRYAIVMAGMHPEVWALA